MSRRTRAALAAVSIAALAATVALAPAAHAAEPEVVASGLNNPRQLSVGPGQRLYVAEGGSPTDCQAIPGAPSAFEVCAPTSSITEIRGSGQERVVTGLPTMSFQGEILGATDVDVRGNNITVLIGGLAGAATLRDSHPDYGRFGTLRTGRLQNQPITADDLVLAADLNAYEVKYNPDGNLPPDSNAVGFAAVDSKNWVVADAGGNDLVAVGKRGERTLTVFPNGPAVQNPFAPPGTMVNPQAVPTDVAIGPDGAYYVSQLTGFPFPIGGSTIYRVTRDGQKTVYATGLSTVTSLAWKGNTLYAVQLDDDGYFNQPTPPPPFTHVGSLRKVNPNGIDHDVVAGGLTTPYGLAIRGTTAYLTINATSAGEGKVIEVSLR